MKIPMTEDRLYIAARVLCELRGIDPEETILAFEHPQPYTKDCHRVDLCVPRKALSVAKEEIGLFVQALTAVEHSYELLPLSDNEKITP